MLEIGMSCQSTRSCLAAPHRTWGAYATDSTKHPRQAEWLLVLCRAPEPGFAQSASVHSLSGVNAQVLQSSNTRGRLGGGSEVASALAAASDARTEPHTTLTDTRRSPTMADSLDSSATGAALEKPAYDPKPSLQYASAVGLQAAGIGALVSAVQNALGTHTSGAAGFLTRTGSTIGFFGMLAAVSSLHDTCH